jgi:hemoglobin-like flavoprotein
MTADRKGRIRETFAQIKQDSEPVAMLFYGKLFALDPSTRKLFHNDLAEQGRKLMAMLASVVQSLDDFDSVRPVLKDLGRRHAEIGVGPGHYQTLRDALLWTLGQVLDADFDVETRAAWSAAIEAINSAMQES